MVRQATGAEIFGLYKRVRD